jgi:plastocyanin
MRGFTARFTLGVGLLALVCAVADTAQAGLIFNRGARRSGAAYEPSAAYAAPAGDPCCCQQGGYGYSQSMYYPGTGSARPMPAPYLGVQPAGYPPTGTIPAPLPSPFPTRAGDAKVTTISITDGAFEPAAMTIQPGQTIRWRNDGKKPHTIASDKGDWGSTQLAPGQTFDATFTKAGEFGYHCGVNTDMKGTISVK